MARKGLFSRRSPNPRQSTKKESKKELKKEEKEEEEEAPKHGLSHTILAVAITVPIVIIIIIIVVVVVVVVGTGSSDLQTLFTRYITNPGTPRLVTRPVTRAPVRPITQIFTCNPACQFGVCTATNVCTCTSGYTGPACQYPVGGLAGFAFFPQTAGSNTGSIGGVGSMDAACQLQFSSVPYNYFTESYLGFAPADSGSGTQARAYISFFNLTPSRTMYNPFDQSPDYTTPEIMNAIIKPYDRVVYPGGGAKPTWANLPPAGTLTSISQGGFVQPINTLLTLFQTSTNLIWTGSTSNGGVQYGETCLNWTDGTSANSGYYITGSQTVYGNNSSTPCDGSSSPGTAFYFLCLAPIIYV